MHKKTIVVEFIVSVFVISAFAGLQVAEVARANFLPLASVNHVWSPESKTYTTTMLTLNFSVSFFVTKAEDRWIAYSLDGGENLTLTGTEYQIDLAWEGINVTAPLPKLSEGSHRIDIYAQFSTPIQFATPDSRTIFFAVDTKNGLDSWTTKASIPTARAELGVVSLNGKIYAIGGFVGGTAVGTNEVYDPATNTWATLSSMPTARAGFGLAVFQNKIYAIGGANAGNQNGGYSSTNVNEIYDPAKDSWTTGAPMPTARAFLEANVVNGNFYLIGGGDFANTFTFGPTALNEVYDPLINSWSTKASVPNAVGYYASAVAENKIFIIGGSPSAGTGRNYNQIYDTKTDSWDSGKPVPVPLWAGIYGASAGVITSSLGQSRIFVIGGHDLTNGAYNLNQVYDVLQDNWTNAASMITPRWELGVAEVYGSLYAIGGLASNGNLTLQSSANEQYTPSEYTGPIPSISPSPTTTPTSSPTLSSTPVQSQSPTIHRSSSPEETIPETSSPSPSPSPTYNLSSSVSPTQQLTPSPTPRGTQDNSILTTIIAALVVAAVVVSLLVYSTKHKRVKQ